MHNNAKYLCESLKSLAGQSFTGFAVVMLDDASTDDTRAVAEAFAASDTRFVYHRNEQRAGMVATWRQAYTLARSQFPSMCYFAWASDHDIWESQWLEKLLGLLNNHPDAVMAYPLAQRIDAEGNHIRHNVLKGRFTTVGNQRERFTATTRLRRGFGNMVYGLYRADALARAGIFRDVPIPDRLLMQELSLNGQIMQVEEVLWLRRFKQSLSLKRQLRALWPVGQRPLASYLPWEILHTNWLMRALLNQDNFSCSRASRMMMAKEQLCFVLRNLVRRRFGLY